MPGLMRHKCREANQSSIVVMKSHYAPDDVVDAGDEELVENSERDELVLEVERRRRAYTIAQVDADT